MGSLSENARGAVFMMVSMVAFVLNDTLMKLILAEMPLFQSIFLRGLVATSLLLILAHRRGVLFPPTDARSRRMIGLRMFGEIGSTICFLTALFHMPIANATAILQSMPLAVTLAAAMFFGEIVGWRRYSAITVGFFGVMIIVQPGSDGFTVYSLWAIVAVCFMVVRDLATRRLTPGIPSIFVALTTGTGITTLAGLVSAVQPWGDISWHAVGLLLVAAVCLVFGYVFNVMSMRHGEIGFVSPFRYTILIWAILLGFVVFGDIPNAMTLLGSVIVVATGIYTFYRERLLQRQKVAQLPG